METFISWVECVLFASCYFEFMDDDSFFSEKGELPPVSKEETLEIEFRDVSFRYSENGKWILRHFNLKIGKGEKLAIVGDNGVGKSTLVKLLTGLFPVTEGDIFINGININHFERASYPEMFAAVYQDINIYAATILENVIGSDDSEEDRLRGMDCLNAIGLKEKIQSLPQKYDTPLLKVIEDTGIELSGGQNQKIAISRALYKNANMIILDEPTASLDAIAESEIYQSFDCVVGNKTAIYISHRLSSTVFCDKIILLSADGIQEYGNHEASIFFFR